MTRQNKRTLLILSDLFPVDQSPWIYSYVKELEPYFNIHIYDSQQLGGITQQGLSQDQIHNHFVDKGLEIATKNLISQVSTPVDIIGFSIGGTITWKAALKGLKIQRLYLVSSTRVRLEQNKPICESIDCFYGDLDPNKPNETWISSMKLDSTTYSKQQGHVFYKDPYYIDLICKFILRKHT